jgi:chromosome segregation protein
MPPCLSRRWLAMSSEGGGASAGDRGILETRAEVLALRDQVESARGLLERVQQDVIGLDSAIEADRQSLAQLLAEQHGHEKAIVGFDAQMMRTADDRSRAARRLELVVTERSRAIEDHATTERRREEAVAAILEREADQRSAEEWLGRALGILQDARGAAEDAMHLLAESRTEAATLTERVSGLDAEGVRLDEAARELVVRLGARGEDRRRIEVRTAELRQDIVTTEHALDVAVVELDGLRSALRDIDERVATLRQDLSVGESAIRGARQALEAIRADAVQLEVASATAAADLNHAAAACFEAVGMSLEDVTANVVRMQDAGELVATAARAMDTAASEDDDEDAPAQVSESNTFQAGEPEAIEAADTQNGVADPEPVILDLRKKIDRLGPVNMMAIEQFDELETRHAFLTTQRQDLLDSIAQTGEAIKKIEKTTRERFEEAFVSVNQHFEKIFTTLFGGGRAGLVLIDQENDPESGIDIIAQPPGKRLQNIQLLSGGEKALTAMALMFAVFRHRPSPFCLLDEIDAPLDDANIGRFVEMLQGMQEHTQFILITHNRKTMEIADRLYGVTMEEPGVSKLISLQLN